LNDNDQLLIKPLGELIADKLKEDIYQRKIKFGSRLIETDLAVRFDVSRSTIREALRILEQEELVISKARKGTFVAKFTNKDLKELTEVRKLIEVKAFLNALDHLQKNHYEDLQHILFQMEQAAKDNDWNTLVELDMSFHQYVIQLCGNSRIIKIYESIQTQVRVYMAHLDQYYSSSTSYYREHKDLYDILLEKDRELVKKQLENHIEYVEERVLHLPDDEEFQ